MDEIEDECKITPLCYFSKNIGQSRACLPTACARFEEITCLSVRMSSSLTLSKTSTYYFSSATENWRLQGIILKCFCIEQSEVII